MTLAALAAASAISVSGLNCASRADIQAAWDPAIAAYQAGDRAKAKALTDDIIAACGHSPNADYPRLMRADIAIGEGDNDGALAALGATARPAPAPVGPYSSFVALRAWAAKKDAAAFARERDGLMAASAKALGDPAGPAKGRPDRGLRGGRDPRDRFRDGLPQRPLPPALRLPGRRSRAVCGAAFDHPEHRPHRWHSGRGAGLFPG